MKLLQTIRFDPSDTMVFTNHAEQNEWAISGAFWFGAITHSDLNGKLKQEFTNGFLSLESFGFSTFTLVAEIPNTDLERITMNLAQKLTTDFGAPSTEEAKIVAQTEIKDITDMCADIPINSVLSVKRTLTDDNDIRESYSLIDMPGERMHSKIWEIIE